MTRRRLLAPAVLAVVLLLAAVAITAAATGSVSLRSPRAAAAQTAVASGAFSQSNSRDGSAILGASAMRPGDEVSGDVTIANTGDIAGAFRVEASTMSDQAGAGGGRLGDRLLLKVRDITTPDHPVTLASGALSAFSGLDLGAYQPQEAHTYRVSATFPDAGPGGDNAFAGASTSVRFVWTATAAAPSPAPLPSPSAKPAAPVLGGTLSVRVRVRGAMLTLSAPRACIPRGGVVRATLGWKKQKRKGSSFVKVRRTDFFVGSRRVRIDKKAPFTMRFKLPLSAAAGSKLTVRARAFIKMRKGPSPKKSVRLTVRVCR